MSTTLENLDRQLTAANLNRARTGVEASERWTPEVADAAERAWEQAAEVAERYLEARFQHEAREAGLHVDPQDEEVAGDPLVQEIRRVRESLAVYEALVSVLASPQEALEIILGAEDVRQAVESLQQRYGLDVEPAEAVVANLSRIATRSGRESVERERDALRRRLRELESGKGGL